MKYNIRISSIALLQEKNQMYLNYRAIILRTLRTTRSTPYPWHFRAFWNATRPVVYCWSAMQYACTNLAWSKCMSVEPYWCICRWRCISRGKCRRRSKRTCSCPNNHPQSLTLIDQILPGALSYRINLEITIISRTHAILTFVLSGGAH